MAKNKISVSFSEKHLHIYTYLKTKENISSYICRLIEDDINSGQDILDLDDRVRKIVNEMLKDIQIVDTSLTHTNTLCKEEIITDEDIDTILNLF